LNQNSEADQSEDENMPGLTFYIVDVFAEEKYAGNQLAVVRNASSLSSHEMQKIAKEMHFSETTFILSDAEQHGGYDVRIFSPEKELPFGGHPTLGTAYIIQQEIIRKPVTKVTLNLKVGQIPVSFTYSKGKPDILQMRQIPPKFGKTFTAETMSKVLRLRQTDFDPTCPIEEVSTGVPFIIAPLVSLDALKRAKTDEAEYLRLIEHADAKAILAFCPETRHKENNLSARVFASYYGVPEDPATGSANGCLAGYLAKHRYLGQSKVDARVEQGYEVGRPSLLLLKAEDKGGNIEVFVGGKTFKVAKGKLL